MNPVSDSPFPATDNISGHAHPVAGWHQPRTVEQVVALVAAARRDNTPL